MNKISIKLLSICFVCMICFTSCERYPIDALLGLKDPVGTWPNPWYIYDDQFNTRGAFDPFLFEYYPWGDKNPYCDSWNNVVLNFECKDSTQSGTNCIKFSWIGNSKDTSDPKKTFISFGMPARVKKGETIDLTGSGYKHLKFFIRGNLYYNCVFEIDIPNKNDSENPWVKYEVSSSEITPFWQEKVISISEDALAQMKDLEYNIALALKVSTGETTNGGTVYLDNIRFTKD